MSGFRFLSESNKNGVEVHLECDFSPLRIQTLTQSHPWRVVPMYEILPVTRVMTDRRKFWSFQFLVNSTTLLLQNFHRFSDELVCGFLLTLTKMYWECIVSPDSLCLLCLMKRAFFSLWVSER